MHGKFRYATSVMFSDSTGGTNTELMTGDVGWHFADIVCNDLHGKAAIAHHKRVTAGGFRGGTVYNSDEITCDNETVLAFLLGGLCDLVLLDDCHKIERFLMRGERTVVMGKSRKAF